MVRDQVETVFVSPEMVTLIGQGRIDPTSFPEGSCGFLIELGQPASIAIVADANSHEWSELEERSVALVVMRDALERLFDWVPHETDGQGFFIGTDLAAIATRMLDDERGTEATKTYRLAKSIELLCDIVSALKQGSLVPLPSGSNLTELDGIRLIAARRIIDEHWAEKLTLGQIARLSGLNRAKLTRGFREIYRCSVTEALAEKRLAEARMQLLSTDLPVGVIGYRSGYSNNASFTRAFGRRFGVSPTDLRNCRIAA